MTDEAISNTAHCSNENASLADLGPLDQFAAHQKEVTIACEDGFELSCAVFVPRQPVRLKVLIAGALGVPQAYYAPFAEWLTVQGAIAMTFDPRGCGRSRPKEFQRSLRGFEADFLIWARSDFAAAIDALDAMAASVPLVVLGHSLGAQLAGMTYPKAQNRIARLVAVASGAGYWREWAPQSRRIAPWLFYGLGPALTALYGYFPGKRFGIVGDLPAGVMRQWSRWCKHREFSWGVSPQDVGLSYRRATFPIRAFGLSDDEAISKTSITKQLLAFANCPSRLRLLSPPAQQGRSVGHLGLFRPHWENTLWPEIGKALFED